MLYTEPWKLAAAPPLLPRKEEWKGEAAWCPAYLIDQESKLQQLLIADVHATRAARFSVWL